MTLLQQCLLLWVPFVAVATAMETSGLVRRNILSDGRAVSGEADVASFSVKAEEYKDVHDGAIANLTITSLVKYKGFHEKTRKCLEEQSGMDHCGQVLIWRCRTGTICGGLGDQIRGQISSFQYAIASERAFFVDWEEQNIEMLDVLAASSTGIVVKVPAALKSAPCKTVSYIDTPFEELTGLTQTVAETEQCLVIGSNKPPSVELHSKLFGHRITYVEVLSQSLTLMYDFTKFQEIFNIAKYQPPGKYVAIAVRTQDGDMEGNPSKTDGAVLHQSFNCAISLCESLGSKYIFVSSSSEAMEHLALEYQTSRDLLGLGVFISNIRPVHSEHHAGSAANAVDALSGFWTDLLIAANADAIVAAGFSDGASSGFAISAAAVGSTQLHVLDEHGCSAFHFMDKF